MSKTYLVEITALILTLLISPVSFADKIDLEAQSDGIVETIENLSYVPKTIPLMLEDGRKIWWEENVLRYDTDYIRLRFTDIKIGQVPFTILVTSGTNATQFIESSALKDQDYYWTGILRGGNVTLTLIAEDAPDANLRIDQIAYQQEKGAALSITNPGPHGYGDLEHIVDADKNPIIWKAQMAVARLSIIDGEKLKTCTGFMVSNEVMVTNQHCVSSNAICKNNATTALFDYQYDHEGQILSGIQASCLSVLPPSPNYNYDYALLKLSNSPGKSQGYLQFSNDKLKSGVKLVIVQHPAGQPKQISRKECAVIEPVEHGRAKDSDFSHSCDTMHGSSGSPVLNEKGEIVGLHHYGFAEGVYWNQNRAIRAEYVKVALERYLDKLADR